MAITAAMMEFQSLTLTHYSEHPWRGPLYSVAQPPIPENKPAGLWCSVDGADDWPTYCSRVDRWLEDLVHATRVVLVPNARVLWISTSSGLDRFTREYGAPWPWQGLVWTEFCPVIRWHDVAKTYQGIIIAPYVWSCRCHLETMWYYGWDCASGCIWDASAVAALEPHGVTS